MGMNSTWVHFLYFYFTGGCAEAQRVQGQMVGAAAGAGLGRAQGMARAFPKRTEDELRWEMLLLSDVPAGCKGSQGESETTRMEAALL